MCNVPCKLCVDFFECELIKKEKVKANKLNNQIYKYKSVFNLNINKISKEQIDEIERSLKWLIHHF